MLLKGARRSGKDFTHGMSTRIPRPGETRKSNMGCIHERGQSRYGSALTRSPNSSIQEQKLADDLSARSINTSL